MAMLNLLAQIYAINFRSNLNNKNLDDSLKGKYTVVNDTILLPPDTARLTDIITISNNSKVNPNLVPNPSFEEFVNFETAETKGWHKVQKSDTPDYFNISDSSPFNNIFKEFVGGAKPKSGNGFVGIFCYRVHPARKIKNIREYIETNLINKLGKDSLYKVEISICLDAESNFAVNNFGILFSESPLQFNEDSKLFNTKPQIEFNFSYTDSTRNWITLQSFYKARGNEKYIILGNFRPDNTTLIRKISPINDRTKKKKWELKSRERAAYYYIDDVIVEKAVIIEHSNEMNQSKVEEIMDTLNINDIVVDSAVVLRNIIFEFNKYDLLPQTYNEVNKLFRLMVNNPKIRIKIEGHTDNIGSYNYNLQLSLRRVEAVARYLIENGINPNRIELAGYSYSYPLTSNSTEEGRKINRRVVFKIIEK